MVRKLPQPVPQAEPDMCRNTLVHVPPRSTHPFPMLRFGCGSPAKAILQTPLGWFSGRSIAPAGLRARPAGVGTAGRPKRLKGGHAAGWLNSAKKNNVVQEKWTRKGLRLRGSRKTKGSGLAMEEGGNGGLAGAGLRDFQTHWSSHITFPSGLRFTSRSTFGDGNA